MIEISLDPRSMQELEMEMFHFLVTDKYCCGKMCPQIFRVYRMMPEHQHMQKNLWKPKNLQLQSAIYGRYECR